MLAKKNYTDHVPARNGLEQGYYNELSLGNESSVSALGNNLPFNCFLEAIINIIDMRWFLFVQGNPLIAVVIVNATRKVK